MYSFWAWSCFYSRLSGAVFAPLVSRGCVPCGCVRGCRWARLDSSLLPRCLAQEGGRTSSAVPTARVLGSIHSHSWTEGPTNPLLLLLLRASVFVTSGRTHRPVQLTQHVIVRFRVCLKSASSHIRWKITEESGEEMWPFCKVWR